MVCDKSTLNIPQPSIPLALILVIRGIVVIWDAMWVSGAVLNRCVGLIHDSRECATHRSC